VVLAAFLMGIATAMIDDTVSDDLLGVLKFLVFLPVAGAAYAAVFHVTHGATPGKLWKTLQVVREDGQPVGLGVVLLREGLLKWLVFGGAAIFVLGLTLLANVCSALLANDRRALHDRFASTLVVDRDSG
jgi:uncharacterized RDD family membrane protein YckC